MNKSLEELACLYVLDQLEGDERASFETRLLREPELAEFVRELEPVLAHGVREIPQHEPTAGALDRIEARIDALRDSTPAPEPRRARGLPVLHWFSFARWGIAAVIAVSLATIAVQSLRTSDARPVVVFVGLDADRNTFAELPMQDGAKDPDARFIQLATLAENFWRKPAERPGATGIVSGESRAYALFDPGSRQGFLAVEQLPVIAAGEYYHLWIVDPAGGRVIDAGTLPMDGRSRGFYSFALAPDAAPMSARPGFFVTVEQGADQPPTQPRGKVVLGRNDI